MDNNKHTANGHVTPEPPDSQSAGDVSTVGHDAHDVQAGHGGHGGTDTSDVPTIVPVGWRQLILPAIILIIVAILVAGPVFNAFASRPAAPAAEQGSSAAAGSTGAEAQNTPAQSAIQATPTPAAPAPTDTSQPVATSTPPATPTTTSQAPTLSGTQTAVAQAGEQGKVARVPVKLEFGGAAFNVTPGSGLLPDWKPEQDDSTATWIANTVANHVFYVPYSSHNLSLFQGVKQGDTIALTMNTGQVFTFAVTRSERAINGPPTAQGQFTVSTAMAQDHAGVTLFLTGDPASDRAVVQADFTGNIQ